MTQLSPKVQQLLDKLGVRVRFVDRQDMPNENTAGYYNTYSNEVVLLKDPSSVKFPISTPNAGVPNYVALHEVIHWEMHQAVRDAIVLSLLSAEHPIEEETMEEISAEAGAEKLIHDYLGVDDMQFIAERIDARITATRPKLKEGREELSIGRLLNTAAGGIPNNVINDSIARGISAAEEVEKKIA